MPPDDNSALHQQIAQLSGRLDERFNGLDDRQERIERALLGDEELELAGVVQRLRRLDNESNDAAKVHEGIEERRRQGDQRIHERLDVLEGKWRLAVGIAIGASISSAGGAAWIVQAIQT